ncbi:Phosphoglucosamine mutase [Streptomyces tanashiensis]
MLDHATTGDGTLTGLMLAARVAATGKSLADLAGVMERLPQILINVKDVDKSRVNTSGEPPRSSPTPSASWAPPAVSCCVPPAPSRWSASWSRPPTSSRPARSRSASRMS